MSKRSQLRLSYGDFQGEGRNEDSFLKSGLDSSQRQISFLSPAKQGVEAFHHWFIFKRISTRDMNSAFIFNL